MNPGVVEETSKHVGTFVDALKREPLSLALVVMNLCLLLFFYVILIRVADQRKEEIGLLYADKKEVRELLAKCVVPERERRGETFDERYKLQSDESNVVALPPITPLPTE